MKTAHTRLTLTQTVLVLSLMAAFAPAHADDEEDALEALKSPDSSLSVGVSTASGGQRDRALFGQYNGLRSGDAKLLLDVDLKRRDDESGIWTLIQGRNLGQDNREFSASYLKQGDWRLSAGYNAITRDDPRTLNTGGANSASTTPRIVSLGSVGSGVDLNLGTKREGTTAGAGKWITPRLLFELDFKNETKEGARLSGRGIACGAFSHDYNVCGAATGTGALLASTTGAILLTPEPISSTIRQIDAKLSYANEGLKVHGGYYGSFYTNAYASQSIGIGANLLNPDGTVLNTATAPGNSLVSLMQRASALSPSNEAHQFYIGGNYALSPTTRSTFKYAFTHATQNADFVGGTLAGSPTSLGGDLNTTLAQLGITTRPMSELTLLGNVRYEDRDDHTLVAPQYVAGSKTYTNSPRYASKLNAKAEASVQLPDNYRVTMGLDYASVHRNRPAATALVDGLSGLREDTRETGYRAELRRSMSETFNASVSAIHSERKGYNWLSLGAGFPVVSESSIYSINGVFPTTLEDRQRDKIRFSADWAPMEDLSVQLMFEDGKDRFTAPTEQGLRDTNMRSLGIDVAWKLSDKWKLTGWWNQGNQTLHLNNVGYLAELANNSESAAIGFVGNPSSQYELGATVSYMNDRNRYLPTQTSGAAPLGGGLTDVNFRLASLKLFGKYALEKNADLRLDVVHQVANLGEWTWSNNGTAFAYSDNSTVSMQPNQEVTFIGVSYIYKLK